MSSPERSPNIARLKSDQRSEQAAHIIAKEDNIKLKEEEQRLTDTSAILIDTLPFMLVENLRDKNSDFLENLTCLKQDSK